MVVAVFLIALAGKGFVFCHLSDETADVGCIYLPNEISQFKLLDGKFTLLV
jgi:hypothetical protein